jgi:hypothetical protein
MPRGTAVGSDGKRRSIATQQARLACTRVHGSRGGMRCGIECAWRSPPGAIGDNVGPRVGAKVGASVSTEVVGERVGGLVPPTLVGAGVPDAAHAQTRAARVPKPNSSRIEPGSPGECASALGARRVGMPRWRTPA